MQRFARFRTASASLCLLATAFSCAACSSDPAPVSTTSPAADLITYTAHGNDGGAWTTTSVALQFNAGIQAEGQDDKLTAENIVDFDDGGTGAQIGQVNGRGNGWSFDLSGVQRSGTISFAIHKDGFNIDPARTELPVVFSDATPGTWPEVAITPVAEDPNAFAHIAAGRYDANESGGPTHEINITAPFVMSTTEISQGLFVELMGANTSQQAGDDLPMTNVNWYDAVEFCNRLSERAGLDPVYVIDKTVQDPQNTNGRDTYKFTVTWDETKNGYRLPTIAEWEYAERAGAQTTYFTGDDVLSLQGYVNIADQTYSQAYHDTAEVSLELDDGYADLAPVGSFSPNAWGLHDMIGNVAEWTWDWQQEYQDADYPLTDPTGVDGALPHENKIARGGSFNNDGHFVTSANASRDFPASAANPTIGIRVVRNDQ